MRPRAEKVRCALYRRRWRRRLRAAFRERGLNPRTATNAKLIEAEVDILAEHRGISRPEPRKARA